MARLVLILPTGTYRAPDFVAAAAAVGAEVVVASEHRQAMAAAMGDRALVIDFGRPDAAADAIVDLHGRAPFDAVVPVDDQGVLVAAMAAARLGLAHNEPAAVAATRNKLTQRHRFTAAGLTQPPFRAVAPDDDVAEAAVAVGTPCVVKPLSLSASRGVIRADDPREATVAAGRVRAIQAEAGEASGALLVERYVPGFEVAVEGLLRHGELELLAVFDKPDPLEGPYFEESLYVTPSALEPSVLSAIRSTTARAVAALGLTEGPIHAELRVSKGNAVVLEVAARSIGGLCARALRFGAGRSLEDLIVRHALDLPLDHLERERAASGVLMLPISRAGHLVAVNGRERARAVPGVEGLEITVPLGHPVRPLPEGDRYLGFLFARAGTPGEVEGALRTASAELEVVIS